MNTEYKDNKCSNNKNLEVNYNQGGIVYNNLNLNKAEYGEIQMVGDGNCFYRCLAFHLERSQDNYDFYRNKIYHYIKKNIKN